MPGYKVVLRKNGAKRGELTGYATKGAAIAEAQELADSAQSGVKVYVEPVRAKSNRKAPRRKNTHLKKGQTAKWSARALKDGRSSDDRMRVLEVIPAMPHVRDLEGKPLPVPAQYHVALAVYDDYAGKWVESIMSVRDENVVAASSKTRRFPGTGYKGKTPRRKNSGIVYRSADFTKLLKEGRGLGGYGPNRDPFRLVPGSGYFSGGENIYFVDSRGHQHMFKVGEFTNQALARFARAIDGLSYKGGELYEGKKPTRRKNYSTSGDTWLQEADTEMEERGTEGAFTKQARRAGYKDTMAFARGVMKGWRSGKKTVLNKKTRKQQRITKKTMYRANFAINAQKRRNPTRVGPDIYNLSREELRKLKKAVKALSPTRNWESVAGRPAEARRFIAAWEAQKRRNPDIHDAQRLAELERDWGSFVPYVGLKYQDNKVPSEVVEVLGPTLLSRATMGPNAGVVSRVSPRFWKMYAAPYKSFSHYKKERRNNPSAGWLGGQDYGSLFDSLKPGDIVELAATSVMGMSKKFDGEFHPWKVGRRSHSKKYSVTTIRLDPVTGKRPPTWAAVKLLNRKGKVSAAHGDMGIFMRGLRRANPEWGKMAGAVGRGVGKAGKAAWKGAKRGAQYGVEYGKEAGARAAEGAKGAAVDLAVVDLERCAGRLGITPDELDQLGPYRAARAEAQQHQERTKASRGARETKRTAALKQRWNNPGRLTQAQRVVLAVIETAEHDDGAQSYATFSPTTEKGMVQAANQLVKRGILVRGRKHKDWGWPYRRASSR